MFPRLSFDEKIIAHRTNRLDQTFGQLNTPYQSNREIQGQDDILIPLRYKTLHENGN